jgi:hypothetical protein
MARAQAWLALDRATRPGAREVPFGVPPRAGAGAARCRHRAAPGDEDAWHTALQTAVDHRLRLIAVDALEGLRVAAARAESWTECVRLLAAGRRLRDELDYRWRFPWEQDEIDSARRLATEDLVPAEAEQAENEGHSLDWQAAAECARRTRCERKRPRHGWESLIPTEPQVVTLIADGLTNVQIAGRADASSRHTPTCRSRVAVGPSRRSHPGRRRWLSGSDRGSPNDGSTALSKRVIAQILSRLSVRT